MVSHKTYTPGHRYRHAIAQHILKYNLPIDMWGNGVDNYKKQYPNNKYIRGGFKSMEEMCKDYLFTIAIENTSHDHYFTEKIINPFINNTIPIYWGCKKVEEYFPKHTIRLTGNITRDVIIIHSVLRNPNKYIAEYKIDQEMVLNKVNLVKNIERIFEV
jgi:NAD-dependent dihydropyrimidine dehydrogenase PreA subunit